MGVITALEVQKRNKKRVSIFIDGEYTLSVSLDEAARLRKGQVISEDEIARLTNDAAITAATDSAARFLGLRPRSAREVRDNLARKDIPPNVIDAAMDKLTALGYIDDRAFAALWVQDRLTFKPTSPRALRYELRQKGIANDIIEGVLSDLDAEDSAYRAAQAQARRLRGTERREFKVKLGAFLQRRGFSYGEARTATRRLMEAIDAEDPDFFGDETEENSENEPDIID